MAIVSGFGADVMENAGTTRGGEPVVRKADRWLSSARRRSVCGVAGDIKLLHMRTWTRGWGAVHDCDLNAVVSILAVGWAERSNVCGVAKSYH
ncbi:hypothetical protein ACL02S_07815 [Nocardia sp. 004]|uniref:hypothetical protein n=1 Tax=Nocardia sp. 004 TaxID=3385978 RepID=UPI0039A0B9FA